MRVHVTTRRTAPRLPGRRRAAVLAARRAAPAGLALLLVTGLLAGCQTGRDGGFDPGAEAPSTTSPDDPVSSDDPPADDPTPDEPAEPAEPVAADVVVVVDATGEGATTTWTLTCEPVGGDHPDAAAACAAIAAAGGAAAFAPTPRDVACTEQWGGPQTATVTGTVGGETINAKFDRRNGCEISRWDGLEPLFGPDAGLL